MKEFSPIRNLEDTLLSQKTIVVKTDLDLTLIVAKDPRFSKFSFIAPVEPIPGASEGISILKNEPDIAYRGISTARNRFICPHTRRQVRKFIGEEEITYTSKSSGRKIIDLLDTAREQEAMRDVTPEVSRVVLIDDKTDGVRDAAQALARDQRYRELMQKYHFTLVAFAPKEGTDLKSSPDGTMKVIPMPDWKPESVNEMLTKLRI